ncbi:MAG: hypothetical protein ABIP32_02355, partial [Chthoniobacterales bacterium]
MMQKGYCLLGQRALFRLEGADRLRYLNGQVSNAVSKATDSSAIQACILTAKGKLCAVVWIWTAPDAILIESDPDLHDSLQARLERYIIADDVTLIDESDRFHLVHVIDPDFTEGIAVLRFGVPGRDLLVPVEERD